MGDSSWPWPIFPRSGSSVVISRAEVIPVVTVARGCPGRIGATRDSLERQLDSVELGLHVRREPEPQFDSTLLALDRDLLLLDQTPLFFKLRAN